MKLEKKENEKDIYLMLNKPAGYITARSDKSLKTIFDILPSTLKNEYTLFPVGRLDKDTEGLIILTNDGKFCHNIIHGKSNIKKVYEFWALGKLTQEYIKEIRNGILLEDNFSDNNKPTKPAEIEILEEHKFSDIKDQISNLPYRKIGKQKDEQDIFKARITIYEGRKHEVKRILKHCKCFVIYLKRLSIGSLNIDENLNLGECRSLTNEELLLIQKN